MFQSWIATGLRLRARPLYQLKYYPILFLIVNVFSLVPAQPVGDVKRLCTTVGEPLWGSVWGSGDMEPRNTPHVLTSHKRAVGCWALGGERAR